jgi:hypothetical protein
MYPTLILPNIPTVPLLRISRPVVGSSDEAQAAEISAQAAMTDDPTIKANEQSVNPVTVPLNMMTSPYAWSSVIAQHAEGMETYDKNDGEVLEDPVVSVPIIQFIWKEG